MITLSGVKGGGALWSTFYLDWPSTSPSYADRYTLDGCIPPCEWILPPPDGKWHDVEKERYGPVLNTVHVGWINSVNEDRDEFNPCQHSTIRGDAIYRGKSGSAAPYWDYIEDGPSITSCTSVLPDSYNSSGKRLTVLWGRPCTTNNPYVYDYRGNRVKYTFKSSSDLRRWYQSSAIHSSIIPDTLQTKLKHSGDLSAAGQWYCRNIYGNLVIPGEEHKNTHWYCCEWYHPSPNVFKRYHRSEYHTTDSYTSPDRIKGFTTVPYCLEYAETYTVCKITHILSQRDGAFTVGYDVKDVIKLRGWQPWDYYGYEKSFTNHFNSDLLILAPGKTSAVTIPTERADDFCRQMPGMVKQLFDDKAAQKARTLAVNDVQELESNWLENLTGLSDPMSCVGPLVDGYKAVDNGDLALARKCLASAYLVYKYVIAPGVSDAQDLSANSRQIAKMATVNRFSNERRRGRVEVRQVRIAGSFADILYTTTYHLRLRDDSFSQVWAAMEKFGIDPSSGQLWDLIPFSFVFDWFISLGDALKTIDRYDSMVTNRHLRARIDGYKVVIPIEGEDDFSLFDGLICSSGSPLKYSWYDRRVHQSIGKISPLDIQSGNGLTASQMAQGAALLTQYLG